MLRLEFPNESHKAMYQEVIDELWNMWLELLHPDSIFWGNGERDFSYVLKCLISDKKGESPWRVPCTSFLLVDDKKIYGALSLRHHINHPNLIHRGGHIGYGIRPSERGKWYATQMLSLWLIEAKKLWLEKVLLTCQSENFGSKRVIEKNGGILESEQTDEKGERFLRYWIEL